MDEKINSKEMLQELYEHTQNRMKEIEQRVYMQFEENKDDYVIYSSIAERSNYDLTDSFLFPMCSSDKKETVYHFSEIIKGILKDGECKISKVYFECDKSKIRYLRKEKLHFNGCIITDKREYEAQFLLKPDLLYWDKVKELKEIFIKNKVQWMPLNAPYLNHFFTVWITYCSDTIPDNEEIKKIVVDFAEYGEYVRYDRIPIWNVTNRFVKTEGFVYPLEGEKAYEHFIRCKGACFVNEKENEFLDIRKAKEGLYITSTTDNSIKWQITEIKKYQEYYNKYDPLMSNGTKSSFLNGFVKNTPYPVYTKEEIKRILRSFTVSDRVILQDFYLEGNVVKFFFQQVKKDYMALDIIEFLMECIQLYMPHYKCEGELV